MFLLPVPKLKKKLLSIKVQLYADYLVINLMLRNANFEWIFILQRYVKFKGYGIYKRLANKYFDRLVKRIRARYNSHLIVTKETIPILKASKAKGELTINGFVSDQTPKPQTAFHWQTFMGIKVPVHTGAEMIAKKLDMTVVFFSVERIKRGYYNTAYEEYISLMFSAGWQLCKTLMTKHFDKKKESSIMDEKGRKRQVYGLMRRLRSQSKC